MTREELSELDRRIAVSVARGEAAIARQEAAVARQQESTAEINAINARMDRRLEQTAQDRGEVKTLIHEFHEMRVEMRGELRELIAELREGRDERRAVLEALMRVIDRLPPAKES